MMTAINHTSAKSLGDLIVIDDPQLAAITISGVQLDSRKVKSGDLFLAYPGALSDGRDYIVQAAAAGAVAVLIEPLTSDVAVLTELSIPIIEYANLAAHCSAIAASFYSHPSQQLPVVGVTGTNGKTSCTQLLMQLVNALDKSCGVMGTLGNGLDGEFSAVVNTTPDAITIQQHLAQWQQQAADIAAMEVSSHGLQQGRVAAVQFELALFTNLSRDHLDYHGSMQAYAQAKALLFLQPGLQTAVLNADDSFSDTLASNIASDVNIIRYSIEVPSADSSAADVWLDNVSYHGKGVSADLHSPWGEFELASPLLGAFNLSNLLAVISCLAALGYPISKLLASCATIHPIDGRMQRVDSIADINVVIDYAHTPDALEKALSAMGQHTQAKLWCVFGCGGDRDQGKRPLMGAIAQRFADHVVVTSDNPRSEEADDIINQILVGVDRPSLVESDRAKAIGFAIANAATGDVILIAGKGHEDYQEVGGQRLPFSDINQARLALAKRLQVGGQ